MINPRHVGQTTACIHTSHIQWFPFFQLQKMQQKIKGFLFLLLLFFMIISENNRTSSFGQCVFFLWQRELVKTSEACMECLTTRVRSHQPWPQLGSQTPGVVVSEISLQMLTLTSYSGHTGPLNKQHGILPPPPAALIPALGASGQWSRSKLSVQGCLLPTSLPRSSPAGLLSKHKPYPVGKNRKACSSFIPTALSFLFFFRHLFSFFLSEHGSLFFFLSSLYFQT